MTSKPNNRSIPHEEIAVPETRPQAPRIAVRDDSRHGGSHAEGKGSIGNIADKQARKDDKIQREARMAIAETFDAWLDWLAETAPEQIEETFFELGCFASATNRRRMFKHAKAPEGVAERAQAKVDQWKAEEEAAMAAAAEGAPSKPAASEKHA